MPEQAKITRHLGLDVPRQASPRPLLSRFYRFIVLSFGIWDLCISGARECRDGHARKIRLKIFMSNGKALREAARPHGRQAWSPGMLDGRAWPKARQFAQGAELSLVRSLSRPSTCTSHSFWKWATVFPPLGQFRRARQHTHAAQI